jgi:DNA-binding response OmpR family regulator
VSTPHGITPEIILVVEDDFDIRDLLQQYLEVSGYRVMVAANGLEGLSVLRSELSQIGLVLLDRNMESMDGKVFLDSISADEALAARKVPVVMMSAAGDVNEGRAVAFLRKPFNFDDLLAVVGRFVKPSAPAFP